MSRRVILHILRGSFDEGFDVRVSTERAADGERFTIEDRLPPSNELAEIIEDFQRSRRVHANVFYRNQGRGGSLRMVAGSSSEGSDPDFDTDFDTSCRNLRDINRDLRDAMRNWLNAKHPRSRWLTLFVMGYIDKKKEAVRFIIDDSNLSNPELRANLQRLPWKFSSLGRTFRDHSFSFAADSLVELLPDITPVKSATVLAILGSGVPLENDNNSRNAINVDEDLEILRNYRKLTVISELRQPLVRQLRDALNQRNFHILYFGGHSFGEEFELGEGGILDATALVNDLRVAVNRGLKVAILNSCDGDKIAQHCFAEAGVPYVIAMSAPVPDVVAHQFLRGFLEAFCHGKSVSFAVDHARQTIIEKGLEQNYPSASSLPILYQRSYAREFQLKGATSFLEKILVQALSFISPPWGIWFYALLAILTAVLIAVIRPRVIDFFFPPPNPIQIIPADELISTGGNQDFIGMPELTGDFGDFASRKAAGVKAFADENYEDARNIFHQIREDATNQRQEGNNTKDVSDALRGALQDPEILIFKNNAEVRLRQANGELAYKIAIVAPLTNAEGEEFDIGQLMLMGIAQIQDKVVNSIGYPKQNIEVIVANDRNIPEQAVKVAQSLAENPDIVAVVGHYTSASTCDALREAYNQTSLTVISPLSTQSDLRYDCAGSSNFFRNTSSTKVEAHTLIEHLKALKENSSDLSVGIFYREADLYSYDLFKAFRAKIRNEEGISLIGEIDLEEKSFDVAASLEVFDEADALIVIPDGRNTDSTAYDRALEVIKANDRDKVVLASNSLYRYGMIGPAGGDDKLADNLFIATDSHETCAPKEFNDEANEYWLGTVNRTTMLTYEAVEALLPILQKGVGNSGDIAQKLAQLSELPISELPISSIFKSPTTISFDENGDRREIEERIVTTVVKTETGGNPFIVYEGECPSNSVSP